MFPLQDVYGNSSWKVNDKCRSLGVVTSCRSASSLLVPELMLESHHLIHTSMQECRRTFRSLNGNVELQELMRTWKNILHPNCMTSTSLRKYLATISQVRPCVRFNSVNVAKSFNKLRNASEFHCVALLGVQIGKKNVFLSFS